MYRDNWTSTIASRVARMTNILSTLVLDIFSVVTNRNHFVLEIDRNMDQLRRLIFDLKCTASQSSIILNQRHESKKDSSFCVFKSIIFPCTTANVQLTLNQKSNNKR